MGAERLRITFRYERGAMVYTEGGHHPYQVVGRRYEDSLDPLQAERFYRLRDAKGGTFWMAEPSVFPGPVRLPKA